RPRPLEQRRVVECDRGMSGEGPDELHVGLAPGTWSAGDRGHGPDHVPLMDQWNEEQRAEGLCRAVAGQDHRELGVLEDVLRDERHPALEDEPVCAVALAEL